MLRFFIIKCQPHYPRRAGPAIHWARGGSPLRVTQGRKWSEIQAHNGGAALVWGGVPRPGGHRRKPTASTRKWRLPVGRHPRRAHRHRHLFARADEQPLALPDLLRRNWPRAGSTVCFHGYLQGRVGRRLELPRPAIRGTVEGVPGVTRFYGPGVTPNVAEVLWNGAGKVVGADTPTVANQNLLQQVLADPTICQSPGGYTRGKFSSIISLFANSGT